MPRFPVAALITIGLLSAGLSAPAEATSKYNACGLLTAAELQAVAGKGIDNTQEKDVVIPSGPYKDETMSTCTWALGTTYVTLNVIRGPRTEEQKSAGLAGFRRIEAGLVQKGWTVEPGKIPGADCNAYKPPASETGARPLASCVMVSKGLAFWLGIGGGTAPTPQQVKGLADKVAARVP